MSTRTRTLWSSSMLSCHALRISEVQWMRLVDRWPGNGASCSEVRPACRPGPKLPWSSARFAPAIGGIGAANWKPFHLVIV